MENKITVEHIAHAKEPTGDAGVDTLNRMNTSHEELTNWALSSLPNITPKRSLDIGCGGGATIKRLLDKYPTTFVNGVDYSNTSVDLSRKFNADFIGSRCDVEWADVTNLPFDDNSFDLITAFETVYFWKDINTAFSQVYRSLNSNGLFLICCEMSDKNNPRWENILDEMHIFDIPTYSELLVKNGFTIVTSSALHDEWICIVASK